MYFLFLMFATIVSTDANIKIQTKSENCTWKVFTKYPETYTLIILTNNSANSFETNEAIVIFHLNNNFEQLHQFGIFNMYIFLLDTIEDLPILYTKLSKLKSWNMRAKFLITFQQKVDLFHFFEIIWSHFTYNAVIIQNEVLYTMYPYRNGSCGESIEIEKLGGCDEIQNVYPAKIPLNLQGCPIKFAAIILTPLVIDTSKPRSTPIEAGLEVTIIHIISQRMNFTEIYVPNPYIEWGNKLPNGTYTHVYGMVKERIVDVMFGFVYANHLFDSDFDATVSHLTDIACWWLPIAAPIPAWKNLTKIFSKSLWLLIILMFPLNGMIWWLIGRNIEPIVYFQELTLAILNSWCVLLQSSLDFPKTKPLRLIFICWCIVSLMLCTAYTSQLVSYLTNPLYEHQMSTVKELLDSDLMHGYFPAVARVFNPKYTIEKRILTNAVHCNLLQDCASRAAYVRDIGVITNIRTMHYMIPKYFTSPNGRKMLFEVRDHEIRAVLRYNAYKGFPYLDRINTMIFGLQENGLIAKWDEDLKYFVQKQVQDDGAKPLTVDHVQASFYILAFGIIIAITVFIIELTCYKINYLKLRCRKQNVEI